MAVALALGLGLAVALSNGWSVLCVAAGLSAGLLPVRSMWSGV